MDPTQIDPFAALGAALGSFALGTVKRYTSLLDGKIGRSIKPLQPLLVYGAGIGLPYLTSLLGVGSVDPMTFITAPVTTLALVSAREGFERLAGRKR